MKYLLQKIYLISFLLILVQINAQERIKFENISVIDGLSNPAIQSILQDSEGFMWFGTADGLNKYDGVNFTVFRDEADKPNSLKGNLVLSIYEDSRKNLWVATEIGLNRYERDSDTFSLFQFDSTDTRQFGNGIVGVYEDSEENLWIGKAYHGLTVFDRDSLKFNQVKVDTINQEANLFAIWSFIEDSNGELWYTKGTNFNNACKLFKLNKSKTREYNIEELVDLTEEEKAFSHNLYIDNNNELWFNSYKGSTVSYNPKNKTFTSHDLKTSNIIFSCRMDKNKDMWFASVGEGLIKYEPDTKSIINYKPNFTDEQSISSINNISLHIDRTGIFWLGSNDKGIDKFDPFKEAFELYSITEGEGADKQFKIISAFSNSLVDSSRIWIGTNRGLHVFDINKKESQHVSKIYNMELPKEIIISSLLEDNNKNLWIGTANTGVYKFNIKKNNLEHFEADLNNSNTISSNAIRDILEDSEGNIWIANQQGVNKYNSKNKSFHQFRFIDSTFIPEVNDILEKYSQAKSKLASLVEAKNDLDSTVAFTISDDMEVLVVSVGEMLNFQNESLWDFGWVENSVGDTIWIMDSLNSRHSGGAIKNRISAGILSLSSGNYKLRYKSDDSHSYGGWNASPPIRPEAWGIEIYQISKNESQFLSQNLDKIQDGNSISDPNIRSLYEDSKGNIWIGTYNTGFSIYNPSNNSFKHYSDSATSVTGFSINRVNSFIEDSYGNMWMATFGGLLKFNQDSETTIQYSIGDGIPTNYIMNLLEDNNGNIWFSSQKGLTQFKSNKSGEEISFVNYDIKDGLQAYQFSNNGYLKLLNGKLAFGGLKGFNIFYPGNINSIPPEVVYTRLLISNEIITTKSESSVLSKSISQTSSLDLSHDQNDISFEFTALHYARPDKNQYAHMLEGFDTKWIYDNRTFATYTNLDPGDYKFKVKASNSDGVWNNQAEAIEINISSPWWATIWAYFSYAIIAGLLFFTFDRGQKRKIILKEREKQRIQAAELRAKAAEAEARVVQAESERKTKELEEARTLQLSMLPKNLPELPNLDIAVYMKTATEVGGDYYDFHVSLDGTLTTVIGDATGHGLNAGTIVTVTKSLFNSHGANDDIRFTFSEISRCLKEMKFKYLSMCLMILKIKGNQLKISSAGMPPALIYRKDKNEIEEYLMRGMPLGAPASIPFELRETQLNKGDTILLMSDGFPELINSENKMFGYDNSRVKFEEVADKEPEEIINYLKDEGSKYVNDADPDDDVTFVVIKVK